MTLKDYSNAKEINLNKKSIESRIHTSTLPCGRSTYKIKLGRKYVYFLEIEKNVCTITIQRYDFFNIFPSSKYENENFISVSFHTLKEDIIIDKDFILNFEEIAKLRDLKNKYKSIERYL